MSAGKEELPEGWIRAPFSAVTVNPIQRVPNEMERITYIDIGSVDRDTKRIVEPQTMLGMDAPSRARKVIQTGDVLVSTVRPNLNAVTLVEKQYDGQFASTGIDVLRAPVVEPRWLFYSVRTPEFLDRMSDLVQGALYPAVRSKDIRSFVIPIAPLHEQKRIADKLDAVLGRVDACRTRLDRVPALLKRFRQSVLAAATSGRLTEEWRGENGVEDGWRTARASDVCHTITDGDHQAPPQATEGIPFITISAINDGKLRLEKATRSVLPSYFEQLKEARKPTRGDVLYSVTGSIGIPAIVDTDAPFTFQRHIAILRPDKTQTSTEYLAYILDSEEIRLQALAAATGTAQLTIPLNGLRNIILPIPPLPEQTEIVRRVEALFAFADRIEARLATAQKTVDRLTPATLAKAFRGELVPQDPNDEPATDLVERLSGGTGQKQSVTMGHRKYGKLRHVNSRPT